jgi:hypothetical protein
MVLGHSRDGRDAEPVALKVAAQHHKNGKSVVEFLSPAV